LTGGIIITGLNPAPLLLTLRRELMGKIISVKFKLILRLAHTEESYGELDKKLEKEVECEV